MAALSPARREAAIAALQDGELDVLVVGGGVVGTGAALDAASRGLRTGLVEATDLAAGASSASSKLIHGGVRYLQMLDFALVREALAERGRLLRLAPHLVRSVPFLYPLRHRGWERPYVGAGLGLYDLLARIGRGHAPRHRQLSRRRAAAIAPGIRREVLVGGIEYWDAQVDDARFVVELARTAASLGAQVLTGATVTAFLGADAGDDAGSRGDENPHGAGQPGGAQRVGGALVGLEDGRQIVVRARAVLAATGAWSGDLESLLAAGRGSGPGPGTGDGAGAGQGGAGEGLGRSSGGAGGDAALRLRPSKGVHLVVPRSAVRSSHALVVPTERSVLFVLPWGEHWIVGTTDTAWQLAPDHPVANRGDVEYLLAEAAKVLDPPLVEADVEAVYAGLRPLVATGDAETTKVSREHAVSRLRPGLYSITGGKYTTYRVMARDAIDALAGELGAGVAPSATADLPLVGTVGFPERLASRNDIAAASRLSPTTVDRLLHRYGGLVDEVLASGPDDETIPGGAGYLAVEARYAASHEGARHLGDVIERRLRLSIETADRGWEAAAAVAAVVAPVLGWDEDTARAEVETYRRGVEARRQAEQAPDDESAERLLAAGGGRTGPPEGEAAAPEARTAAPAERAAGA
ncbi:MAG TPA: glycerol-3-phosphate dehydrogenase/oxidase [Acidimicrobiales bacterium]|nr:glycerol-3-phosphate dehydrogenase/oxidase [Acidimicrobiales bacterium]